jgi:hypothetical protein
VLLGNATRVTLTGKAQGLFVDVPAGSVLEISTDDSSQKLAQLPDGAEPSSGQTLITRGSATLRSYNLDVAKMISTNKIIMLAYPPLTAKRNHTLQQVKDKMAGMGLKLSSYPAPSQPQPEHSSSTSTDEKNANGIEPISFISSSADQVQVQTNQIFTLVTSDGLIKHAGNARFSYNELGSIEIEQGELLIKTTHEVRVISGNCTAVIAPNTIALVVKSADVLQVFNICEPNKNCIHLYVGDNFVSVPAGQEAMLGAKLETLVQVLKSQPLGRRCLRYTELNDQSLIQSEVSVISLFSNSGVLSGLLSSSSPEDKLVIKQIVKMAGCILMTTSSHGDYSEIL